MCGEFSNIRNGRESYDRNLDVSAAFHAASNMAYGTYGKLAAYCSAVMKCDRRPKRKAIEWPKGVDTSMISCNLAGEDGFTFKYCKTFDHLYWYHGGMVWGNPDFNNGTQGMSWS